MKDVNTFAYALDLSQGSLDSHNEGKAQKKKKKKGDEKPAVAEKPKKKRPIKVDPSLIQSFGGEEGGELCKRKECMEVIAAIISSQQSNKNERDDLTADSERVMVELQSVELEGQVCVRAYVCVFLYICAFLPLLTN